MHHPTSNRPLGHSNTHVQNQVKFIPWTWEGVLAHGAVTLLSAPEKIGKTTLLSLLLDRRRAGGLLLGRSVSPGKTILCSEEDDRLWALRQPPLDFGSHLIYHRPYLEYPSRGKWKRFIDDVLELSGQNDPFDLLVIDTAVSFLPLGERSKRVQRWALGQLRIVADQAAVLVLNQSRNMRRPLAAFADLVIEMAIPRSRGPTRRRTFTGVGRYPDSLQAASAELNPEGTDYVLLPDSPPPPPSLLDTLLKVLADSPTPLTHRELQTHWPNHPPREDSLYRALSQALQRGLLTVTGAGTKTDAFRFSLAREKGASEVSGDEC
jgi:hypothetical protein